MEAFRERSSLHIIPPSSLSSPARKLPWEERSVSAWRQLVKPSEAARLFMFLGKKIGRRLDPQSIQDWHLSTALRAFWDGNTDKMEDEAGKFKYPRSDTEIGKEVSRNVGSIESLLDSEFISLSMRRRAPVAICPNESEERKYQEISNKLAEILWPITKRKLHINHHENPYLEEFLSASAERFTTSLHSQYWESMYIDPFASVMHFISRTMPRGPQIAENHSDTRGMETSAEKIDLLLSRGTVSVYENPNEGDLDKLIGEIVKNPKERVFLTALAEGQYFEFAARCAGLKKGEAERVHRIAARRLRSSTFANISTEEVSKRRVRKNFWEYFFGNREALKTLVEKNGYTLPPFRKKLVEAAVVAIASNKGELLDALEKEFPAVARTTLRRHVGSGIDRLRGKEAAPEAYRSHLSPSDKHTAGVLVTRAQKDPLLWSNLTPRAAEVLSVHFAKYPERVRQVQETAEILGIDRSRVSRHIKTGLKILTAGSRS